MYVEGVSYISPSDLVRYLKVVLYCVDNGHMSVLTDSENSISITSDKWSNDDGSCESRVYLSTGYGGSVIIAFAENGFTSLDAMYRPNHIYNLEYRPDADSFNTCMYINSEVKQNEYSTVLFSDLTEEYLFQCSTVDSTYSALIEIYSELRKQDIQSTFRLYMMNFINTVLICKDSLDAFIVEYNL